jgi:putative transcriptional regulator
MTTKAKKPTRLTKELLEMARGMRKSGVMPEAAYQKITMRHLAAQPPRPVVINADDIREMRERAQMSQAVFARHLNVTVGYISQLERGTKRATGAALMLLSVIQRKGMNELGLGLAVNDGPLVRPKRAIERRALARRKTARG